MLNAIDLGCQYQDWVFRHLQFELPPASFTTLLGANGQGKSSLMRILAGLQNPNSGRVVKPAQVGYVPQSTESIFNMPVLDMVVMGRAHAIDLLSAPDKQDYAYAKQMLEKLDIAHLANQSFQRLSGGQRQLVLLARALCSQAKLLILDEPTAALDWHNQALILNTLRKLVDNEGYTVLLSTHNPQHSLEFSDYCLLLFDKDDFAFGDTHTLLNEQTLCKLYNLPVKRLYLDDIQIALPIFKQPKEG
ncbi:MAG: ABC transporter ATP-binding protein [Thiomicrospira sp.]|jgi:iron complex transport system ATP-binding protein|nr:ABC transporter ATP-binding protein [Thiomicrospira sp.]